MEAYVAECLCGWRSRECTSMEYANDVAAMHTGDPPHSEVDKVHTVTWINTVQATPALEDYREVAERFLVEHGHYELPDSKPPPVKE